MTTDSCRDVERYGGFNSFHCSHFRRPETGRIGEAALRQQLSVLKRDVQRPKLKDRDRLFWIGLRMIWQDWKSALG
jgi:hypothetical protein